MAKNKFSLVPRATFTVAVGLPIPGDPVPTPVEFVFKHRNKAQIEAFRKTVDLNDEGITVSHVREMAESWALDDEFTEVNIDRLLSEFPGSGLAIYAKYMGELQDAKLGNFAR